MNFRQLSIGKKLLIGVGAIVIIYLIVLGVKLNTKSTATSDKPATTSSSQSGDKKQYVTIDQWHVRAPKSGTLDLEYIIQTDLDNPSRYAEFDSKQLTAADPACAKHGGAIQRYKENDRIPVQNLPARIYFDSQPQGSFTFIDGYYYTYVAPLLDCSVSADANALQQQTAAAVKDVVHNLEFYSNK